MTITLEVVIRLNGIDVGHDLKVIGPHHLVHHCVRVQGVEIGLFWLLILVGKLIRGIVGFPVDASEDVATFVGS
jgi:hypothetical protein